MWFVVCIHPVYLLYKNQNLLILAYGVSEDNRPKVNWNREGLQTISDYFTQHDLGKPKRYGSSYVFKTYNLNESLNETEVNTDLSKIIEMYNDELLGKSKKVAATSKFKIESFQKHCEQTHFMINEMFTTRFICSLLAKPFVILTGLSGSGKTKLALKFANWISADESQVCIVPVGADWTNREPLLGFPNALETGKYVPPDCGALQLILEASQASNKNKPYFLILDEMNLSHVERYFADFLSAMESGQPISLHSTQKKWKDKVPANIKLPPNLFIIGTVNIDETTYMFSPKVLDRANVLEFRVTEDEMAQFLSSQKTATSEPSGDSGSKMATSFLELVKKNSIDSDSASKLQASLLDFFKILKQTGAEFGYRSATEIMNLATIMINSSPELAIEEIIDVAIIQKLLPKVHGSRRKLEPILKSLAKLCLKENKTSVDPLSSTKPLDPNDPIVKYSISLEKIQRMYRNLLDNGFTSYAEA